MTGVPKEDRTVTRSKKILLVLGGTVLALAILAVGGTWVYINVIKDEPPAKLSFESEDASSTTVPAGSTAPTVAANGAATTAGDSSGSADSSGPIDGAWSASNQSQLGYRVKEVLFGQSTEGVGRTNAITGTLTIDGTTVEKGDFTVDMTTVQSDSGNRDNQFQGRIMDTSKFPTSTFTLTQPIDLGSVPAEGQTVSATATGDLTLRGTTKPVTFDVQARLKDGKIEVNGSIPIVFADYNIPNPSFGPASTADNGTLEFLLVFAEG